MISMKVCGVAKRKESVPLLNGGLIRVQNILSARESGHQHDQRRFRKMEVGDQPVHYLELIAGIDEDRGIV